MVFLLKYSFREEISLVISRINRARNPEKKTSFVIVKEKTDMAGLIRKNIILTYIMYLLILRLIRNLIILAKTKEIKQA